MISTPSRDTFNTIITIASKMQYFHDLLQVTREIPSIFSAYIGTLQKINEIIDNDVIVYLFYYNIQYFG
jgi:hypothetical protein